MTQSYNSSLSNDSFPEKQTKLKIHGLKLNSTYFDQSITRWDAETIADRANWLTEKVLEIWPSFETQGEVATIPKAIAPAAVPPKAIIIRGERMPTKTSRDVLRNAAVYVGKMGINFVFLSGQIPKLVSQTPFPTADYDWGNGWHLNIHGNAPRMLDYAKFLLRAAGIEENEWQLED